VAGFEPATSWSQTRRDTGLRYTPKRFAKLSFKIAAANIFEKNVPLTFLIKIYYLKPVEKEWIAGNWKGILFYGFAANIIFEENFKYV
jgi:hypothetical protein